MMPSTSPLSSKKHCIARCSASLAALTLAGCLVGGGGTRPKLRDKYPPPLFEDYVTWIKARSTDQVPYNESIPVIPPSLQFTAPMKLENPSALPFHLASLDATKICFVFASKGDKTSDNADAIAKQQLERWQELGVAVRALSSLASEKGKPLWPAPADATHLEESVVVSDEVKDFDDDGTVKRRRVITYNLCGPAPRITSETKFVAITAHPGGTPEFKSLDSALDDADRRNIERYNQEQRMTADAMILIAITDGKPDLSL